MSALKIRRLGYALGAEITGVDTSAPLDAGTIAEINQAILDHIIVCFPGQDLDVKSLSEFSGRFGEHDVFNTRVQRNRHPDYPEITVRYNKPIIVDGKQTVVSPPADQWHNDFAHSVRPSTLTFLTAKSLPEIGGDTMFANQYMAYETLSPAFQRLIEPLDALHDITLGITYVRSSADQKERSKDAIPPAAHPVVRVHPETGRKALYVQERVRNFVGMTEEETQPLLRFLMDYATRYELIYRHKWQVGDLLVWDNRCVLHKVVSDYDQDQIRNMLRTSLIEPEGFAAARAQAV